MRNRLKIEAAIDNVRRIRALRGDARLVFRLARRASSAALEAWTLLFRKTLRFTGAQIVGEFLMSLGYLPGAHETDCAVFAKIAALSRPWLRAAA